MPNTAEVIVKILKEEGVDRIFGIPGSKASTDIIRAANQNGIETILTGHESGAAMIASVYGEITGVPGACFAITGPGATNLASGVAYAYLERAPLLVFLERHGAKHYENIYTQKIDQASFFTPITKDQFLITAQNAQQVMEKAILISKEERPGPVLLELTKEEAVASSAHEKRFRKHTVRFSHFSPDETGSLSSVKERINKAGHPVIIAGMGANRSKASAELTALSEKINAPVMVTLKGRGVFDEGHPLYGGFFLGAFNKGTFEDAVIIESDLLIIVGLDPVELLPKPWGSELPVIHIGPLPDLENICPVEMEVVGNIKTILGSLADGQDCHSRWEKADLDRLRETIKSKLSFSNDSLPLHRIVELTREKLPKDGILATDVGAFNSMVNYLWQVRRPGTFYTTKGLSTMGFALPAAIAAQLAQPDKKIVCFIGDGSLLMCLQELALCSRLKLPIIIVVFSDSALGLIKVKQQNAGQEPVGVDFENPDFPRLAEAFGGIGFRTETEAEFNEAMDTAIQSRKLCLIEAILNPDTYGDHIKLIRG